MISLAGTEIPIQIPVVYIRESEGKVVRIELWDEWRGEPWQVIHIGVHQNAGFLAIISVPDKPASMRQGSLDFVLKTMKPPVREYYRALLSGSPPPDGSGFFPVYI